MRVSNLGIKNNFINNVRHNYSEMKKVQTKLITGKKNHRPSASPAEAINSVYYRSRVTRIKQYQKNVDTTGGVIDAAHNKLSGSVNIMHRVRELAVQAAHGTYNDENRVQIASEVDEMLKELVSQANGKFKDEYLFAGTETNTKPFKINYSKKEGLNKPVISSVKYMGNDGKWTVEVSEGDRMSLELPGNAAFWGNQHTVVSRQDGASYVASENQTIRIDGHDVLITAGDNIDAVVQKINENVPTAYAFVQELPDGRQTLGLESNAPHKLFMDDLDGGTVLKDLGMIRPDGAGTGNNIHENALQSKQSVFDIVIRFRDALLTNNIEDIGSRDLASIDEAIDNVLTRQAALSSQKSRLDTIDQKLSREEELAVERLAKNEDVDIARASLEFNQIANVHRVSLMTASKLVQPTLLDFVR